ncbi:MAG: hypothetical protein OJF49_003945 [Ktedonobacterales bacterium]|jgi:transcriptional regulator with XRE-family HTH domain|nr:MAG: hypothetical protein OJF49_003945 [Ktedonobacterales bacterium]
MKTDDETTADETREERAFWNALKSYRDRAGLTQAELGAKAGYVTITIRKYEGERVPPVAAYKRIVGALGLDAAEREKLDALHRDAETAVAAKKASNAGALAVEPASAQQSPPDRLTYPALPESKRRDIHQTHWQAARPTVRQTFAVALALLTIILACGVRGVLDAPLGLGIRSLDAVRLDGWFVARQWVVGEPRILGEVNARTGAWRVLWPTEASLEGGTPTPATADVFSALFSPVYAPRTHILAFISGAGGKSSLWLAQLSATRDGWLEVAGAGPRMLVGDCSPCSTLAWSPDGNWLLYNGSAGLVALSPDTGAQEQVTNEANDAWPACSPDGRWLAFQRAAGRLNDIVALPAHGCLPVQNPWTGARYLSGYAPSWRPAWSPDSLLLAFASNANASGKSSIYMVALAALSHTPSFAARSPADTMSRPGCTDPAWAHQAGATVNLLAYACDDPSPTNHHGTLVVVPGMPDPPWQAQVDEGILARDNLCWIPAPM